MVTLNKIHFTNNGRRIEYDYNVDSSVAKYFNKKAMFFSEYDVRVDQVAESITVIPFLANFAPICWFAGIELVVNEADQDFLDALASIKDELSKYYPQLKILNGKISAERVVKNTIGGDKSVMLFSGGVDAFATYFRHYEETPELVTIQGADIELTDTKQWAEVQAFNANEPILRQNEKHYVVSNIRDFYTYDVDLLIDKSWWGNIQHGLALVCSLAPLSAVQKYKSIYIASTRSIHMEFNQWGSMPETDEKISWAGINVIHDGFELKRQDKVDQIVNSLNELNAKTTIRVCYSDLKENLNCSRCEKCVRTIFGIMLAGGNPNDYGFEVDSGIYNLIDQTVSRGFKTRGAQFFWTEILQKTENNTNFFYFSDYDDELAKIKILQQKIKKESESDIVQPGSIKKFKLLIGNRFPKLFSYYLKVRRSFN